MNNSVQTTGQKLGKVVMFIVLLIMGLVTIFPIAFMFMNSFKSQAEIVDSPLALPKEITFKYISHAMTEIKLVPSILLTVLITVLAVGFHTEAELFKKGFFFFVDKVSLVRLEFFHKFLVDFFVDDNCLL